MCMSKWALFAQVCCIILEGEQATGGSIAVEGLQGVGGSGERWGASRKISGHRGRLKNWEERPD